MTTEYQVELNSTNNIDVKEKIIESINKIMTHDYILDQNYIIHGNLNVNTKIIANDITNMNEAKEAKNLSDLIGKKKELKGDLTIDTLIVSQTHNFEIKVLGDSNFKMCRWIWKRED